MRSSEDCPTRCRWWAVRRPWQSTPVDRHLRHPPADKLREIAGGCAFRCFTVLGWPCLPHQETGSHNTKVAWGCCFPLVCSRVLAQKVGRGRRLVKLDSEKFWVSFKPLPKPFQQRQLPLKAQTAPRENGLATPSRQGLAPAPARRLSAEIARLPTQLAPLGAGDSLAEATAAPDGGTSRLARSWRRST